MIYIFTNKITNDNREEKKKCLIKYKWYLVIQEENVRLGQLEWEILFCAIFITKIKLYFCFFLTIFINIDESNNSYYELPKKKKISGEHFENDTIDANEFMILLSSCQLALNSSNLPKTFTNLKLNIMDKTQSMSL